MFTSWSTTVTFNTSFATGYFVSTSRVTYRNTLDECVVEGTLVHIAEGVQRPVETLQAGQSILTMDGSFNVEGINALAGVKEAEVYTNALSNEHTAVSIWRADVIGTVNINNGQLRTTMGHIHIIKRDGMWQAKIAENLEVGDVMFKLDYGEFFIESLEMDEVNEYTVYKLNVEPNDTFFANGILTHNKKDVICSPEDYCERGHPCEDRTKCL